MEANNEREEWVYLMLEAKNVGLSIEDVREFIKENELEKTNQG
ncbi:anti-repressor SinI family protein [Peribacillus sp. AS_2]|nr:anti-repressor SinI family protein [Peribacillus sp. AS_2]MCZ0873489.1 anti-repressor SinI family protein [Peribacillus sp. AS_2]